MEKTIKTLNSSMLYRKIDELGLTSSARAEAVAALDAADRLGDGIYWVFEKIHRVTAFLGSNAKLKHQ